MSMDTQYNSSFDLPSQSKMRSGSNFNTQPLFGSGLNSKYFFGGYNIFNYPSLKFSNEILMNTYQQNKPT